MTDSEKTTVKVKPGADPVQAALSRITKLGAGGTAALLAAVIGVGQWINSKIEHTVQSAVEKAIRESVEPQQREMDRRITRLEWEWQQRKENR